MYNYRTICICGGGGLGHTIAASLNHNGYQVNLLTGHPEQWSNHIHVTDCNGTIITGEIAKISKYPEEVIPFSDIILLCVPGYLIQKTLHAIAPYVNNNIEIGTVISSGGFFWMARHELGKEHRLFGFQRVPYISRVKEYGKSAELKGYKSKLMIGGNKDSDLEGLAAFFTKALSTPTVTLGHYLEATLTNSNPILHPSRIYGMLSSIQADIYEKEFLFYEEWDNTSSEVLIQCDQEFQNILSRLAIQQEEIPSLLQYYESTDAVSLTRKIRSIEAFKGIKMTMVAHGNKFKVDYTNRYFTEDVPYGLLIIKSLGLLLEEETPMIDRVILWMQKKMGKCYLANDNKLTGKDIRESGIVQNFGINTIEDLYNL